MTDESTTEYVARAMTIRLPADLHEHYRTQAFQQRTSMSALIIAALYNDAREAASDAPLVDQDAQMPSMITGEPSPM